MRPLANFPDAWGAHRSSIQPIVGPALYTQYTAPSTGGQAVELASTGLRGVQAAWGAIGNGITRSGLYRAEVVQIEPGPVGGIDRPGLQLRLKWYVVASGDQVAAMVDLSDEIVDIFLLAIN